MGIMEGYSSSKGTSTGASTKLLVFWSQLNGSLSKLDAPEPCTQSSMRPCTFLSPIR